MKVKPLGDRILVKEASTEEVSKSGIILPDTADKKKSGFYEVVAIGDGEAAKAYQVGQKVIAGWGGEEVEMKEDPDTKYKVLSVGKEKNESDVVAIVE